MRRFIVTAALSAMAALAALGPASPSDAAWRWCSSNCRPQDTPSVEYSADLTSASYLPR